MFAEHLSCAGPGMTYEEGLVSRLQKSPLQPGDENRPHVTSHPAAPASRWGRGLSNAESQGEHFSCGEISKVSWEMGLLNQALMCFHREKGSESVWAGDGDGAEWGERAGARMWRWASAG